MRIAYLGFGTVNRALHALLARQRDTLAHDYGITCRVTGVATRRGGWLATDAEFDPFDGAGTPCHDVHEWLAACRPDVVFEATPLAPASGQPALEYLRAILEYGAHAISANKGPVVYGYRELKQLAAQHRVCYRFESAVMDGAPVFSLVRALPLAGIRAVRGVFTSTATVVLEAVERGESIAAGIAHAQQLGIAEADPSYDVDGWDTAVKLCVLANVLFDRALRPPDVARTGLQTLSDEQVRLAHAEGRPFRLVGQVAVDANGDVTASVLPLQCALGVVHGATLVTHYEADMFPGGLTVTSHDPDATTTAYGMLTDLISAITIGTSAVAPKRARLSNHHGTPTPE